VPAFTAVIEQLLQNVEQMGLMDTLLVLSRLNLCMRVIRRRLHDRATTHHSYAALDTVAVDARIRVLEAVVHKYAAALGRRSGEVPALVVVPYMLAPM
jgi:hypothetical protein